MTSTARTTVQARQPAGVPVGGQFATTVRGETATTLVDSGPSPVDERTRELSPVEMVAAARQSVRTHAYARGVRFEGEDDMVQATLEAALANKRSNGTVVITRPYLHKVAFGIAAQAARGNLRQEDRKAIGILQRQVTELEAELGHRLTPVEVDALAAKIRNEWHDPRHKPSADFVRLAQMRTLSLDAPHGADGDTTLADSLAEDASFATTHLGEDDRAFDPDTLGGLVMSGQMRGAEAKSRAWDVFAETTGLPPAAPVTQRAARAARVTVGGNGGVVASARGWLSGDMSASACGLFAPFGSLDDGDRDAIAEMFARHPAYAEELWGRAMSQAAKR